MSVLQNQLNLIKQEKDTKILPENIRKGITIYNITGTMEGGGGTSGVKQFDSIANMQADPNPNDGDLATVYASSQLNMSEDTQTQYVTFPETVILPETVTDNVEVQFKAVDESIMFDCWGQLNSERFSIDLYIEGDGEYINYRIQYESSDGINYTRTRFEDQNQNELENPVDMTTPIVFGSRWSTPTWNDLIGYFMIVGSTLYTGLWKYTSTSNLYEHVPTQINVTSENIYGNKKAFDGVNTITGTLHQTNNLSIEQVKNRVNLYQNLSYLELNDDVTNMANMFQSQMNMVAVPNINTSKVIDMSQMFQGCPNLRNIPNFDTSNVTNMYGMFSGSNGFNSVPNFNTINVVNMSRMFAHVYDSNWNLKTVPNFDTSNVTNMAYMFDGCKVIENIPNFNTVNVTNMVNMFYNGYQIDMPNLDTSNVTNMYEMFGNCFYMKTVYDYNTINVTNMRSMFFACHSITRAPAFNTSNVTDMGSIFWNCFNLKDVPMYDLSNVTYMYYAFVGCNNLSASAYANIANMLPNATQLTNQTLLSLSLNSQNFTKEQQNILYNKGYYDAIWDSTNWATQYNVYYTT